MLILRGIFGGLIQIALFGAFLVVPAGLIPGGTWYWPRALLFLGLYGLILETTIVVLAFKAPASLEARLRAPDSRTQPRADRVVTAFLMLSISAWFVSIPLEVFHLKLLPAPPLAVSALGAGLILGGFSFVLAAIYENAFATPMVQDQTEQGQVLVDTGPYARVRHPLYLGILPFLAGIALWLESCASLLHLPVILGMFVARIVVEEKILLKTLPGYDEYMTKVKCRLIPLVW